MTNQTKSNNLNYLIDPTFNKVNKNYEKIIEINKNSDYTTGNLSDYEYFTKHCKLIPIDLSKQIQLENRELRQQFYFIGKLEDDRATMLFIIKKSEETTSEFSQNSVSII